MTGFKSKPVIFLSGICYSHSIVADGFGERS